MTTHPDGITLNDFVDGALAPDAQAGVGSHVASCAECRLMVEGLRGVQAAARRLTPLSPRPDVWHRVERSMRATRVVRRPARWTWLAAAAALVLATFIGVKLADRLRKPATGDATGSREVATAQSVEA